MTTDLQQEIHDQIHTALEVRLSQFLKIEKHNLPALSVAEILSLLFGMFGHLNILGGFGETVSAARALIGDDLFLRRPKINPTSRRSLQLCNDISATKSATTICK